jgi:two-component system sensor histidine kinase KdpD
VEDRKKTRGITAYAVAVLTVSVATALAFVLFGRRELADVVMLYLLGIVLVATRFGFRASVLAGVLSVLAFDFFFVPPYLSFSVADVRHIVTFGVMLLVAVVIASLTQRVRDQVDVAQRSEHRTALLYAMSRELSRTEGLGPLTGVAARHVEQVFGSRVGVFTAGPAGQIQRDYATSGSDPFVEAESGVVHWVMTKRREAGLGTRTLGGSRGFYVPLVASGATSTTLGVLGIYPDDPTRFDDPEQQTLADAFATQMAMAIERARLASETQQVRREVEVEQLRSTLLSSVSHDLRTPLAVMRGAASSLVDDDKKLGDADRRELALALLEETERLDRQVGNLLDMTRLESGALRIKKEWQSLQEVVGAAFNRLESQLGGRSVRIDVPADLVAAFDGVLFEQVVVNLLENASKYTPEGAPVEVIASASGDEVSLAVADHGLGIPIDSREHIFEKFQRGPRAEARGGVGLGLAICRAVLTAHGGRIWVEEHLGGGAAFKLVFPLGGEPPEPGTLPEIPMTASEAR